MDWLGLLAVGWLAVCVGVLAVVCDAVAVIGSGIDAGVCIGVLAVVCDTVAVIGSGIDAGVCIGVLAVVCDTVAVIGSGIDAGVCIGVLAVAVCMEFLNGMGTGKRSSDASIVSSSSDDSYLGLLCNQRTSISQVYIITSHNFQFAQTPIALDVPY